MIQKSDSDLETKNLSISHPSKHKNLVTESGNSRKTFNRVSQLPASSQSTLSPNHFQSDLHNGSQENAHKTKESSPYYPHHSQAKIAPSPTQELTQNEPEQQPTSKDSSKGNGVACVDLEASVLGLATDAPVLPADSNGTAIPLSHATSIASSQEAEPELGLSPVLKNRNFLALWMGQVFSQMADKVYLVLMIALIESEFHTGNQTISAWVSAIMIAFTIPAVLFGSLAGVFVDRWSKQAVLVSTNLLRGGLVIALPLLLWLAQGWGTMGGLPAGFYLLLAVTFLVSTLTQFFAPAEQAVIPLVVERRHLLSANSLYTTTMMATVIIGFAVGQPMLVLADKLMARLGHWGYGKEWLVGGSYAIAGLILLLLKTGEQPRNSEREEPHVLADLRDGLRYLKQQRRVRTALLQLVILFSIFAALSVLAVRLAEVIPGLNPSQFGFLMAAGGVGMGISAAILGHFGQGFSHTWLSLVGSGGVAAALSGLALFPHHLWLVLLLVMLLGSFGALVAVPMQTTIQKETPPEMRGKVFGLQNNGINIALTLPLALAGVAETCFGLQVVFLGLAAVAIAGGLLTWYICRTTSHTSTPPGNLNG